jgi:hypothetical protein
MNTEMRAAIDAVAARDCECLACGECRGSGMVWFAFPGSPYGEYLGNSRRDDLDELETCEECGGSGIIETCQRCAEMDELYDAAKDC